MIRNKWMLISEVAAYLDKHPNTVRRWAREADSRGGEYNGLIVKRDVKGRYCFDSRRVYARKKTYAQASSGTPKP